MVNVGVTGAGSGATRKQEEKLWEFMCSFKMRELHHGDCIGVDAMAHHMALSIREETGRNFPQIHIHPPDNPKKRAFCQEYDVIYNERPYLKRDGDIAKHDILIALPEGLAESYPRSGTWYTINHARKLGWVLVIIIMPSGEVKFG